MRIVDDALLPDELRSLQDVVLDKLFPWFYARTAYDGEDLVSPYLRGWVHYILPDNAYNSPLTTSLPDLLTSVFNRLGEPVESFWRLRAIANTIAPEPLLTGVHTDFHRPHKTAILYLNDADGETMIFNEKWSPDHSKDVSQLTVAQKIVPTENRLVFFDGLHLHTGTLPTLTGRRVAININYV